MKLTIAIATWNRCALLGQTLASLGQLAVPPGAQVEVCVCDNNSTDATPATITNVQATLPFPVRPLFEPRQGKSFALNRILAQSAGDWVLFLDDDVQVDPGWLAAMARGMERYPNANCLGGPILPWLDQPVHGRRAFLLGHYPAIFGTMTVAKDMPMSPPETTAWGANLALRRAAVPVDGFATNQGMIGHCRIAGEDVGMCQAVLAGGGEGWLLSDAIVRHWTPHASIGTGRFWRWHMGLGRVWTLQRGRPRPGRLGVAWWAWREFLARLTKAVWCWRPWPTRAHFDAVKDAAQYYGYLRS